MLANAPGTTRINRGRSLLSTRYQLGWQEWELEFACDFIPLEFILRE